MKKTFLVRRREITTAVGGASGVVLLAFAAAILVWRMIAPNSFLVVFSPILRLSDSLARAEMKFAAGFSDASALAEDNKALRAENAALSAENNALRVNNLLFGLDFGKGIIAGVVARPPTSPYDTLIIAAGDKLGVTPGMEAFAFDDSSCGEDTSCAVIPIGFVSSVSIDFSRVKLFSSPGTITNGWVGKSDNKNSFSPLALHGTGGGTFIASSPRDADFSSGDVVYMPGPGPLPFGTIIKIDQDLSAPNTTLYIQPTVNIFSVTFVVLRDTGAAYSERENKHE